jgi:hypothetical protein
MRLSAFPVLDGEHRRGLLSFSPLRCRWSSSIAPLFSKYFWLFAAEPHSRRWRRLSWEKVALLLIDLAISSRNFSRRRSHSMISFRFDDQRQPSKLNITMGSS